MGFGIGSLGLGVWDLGFGIWDLGLGSLGVWEFGIWDREFGIWDLGLKLERWICFVGTSICWRQGTSAKAKANQKQSVNSETVGVFATSRVRPCQTSN